MTNQLYQLIPEPAGDWQEGDRNIYNNGTYYRLRPVKAQAGQLWRDLVEGEQPQPRDRAPFHGGFHDDGPLEWQYWEPETIYESGILWQRRVPIQACACEGLRELLFAAEQELRDEGYGYLPDRIREALAQSCPCQSRACGSEQPISVATEPSHEVAPGDDSEAKKTYGTGLEAQPVNKQSTETEQPAENVAVHPPKAAASEAQEWNPDQILEELDFPSLGRAGDILREYVSELCKSHNSTVAALRRELEEAQKALDENWVTHQRVVKAETDRDKWRDQARHWEAIKRVEWQHDRQD